MCVLLQRLLSGMFRLSFWVWKNSWHVKPANSTIQLCVLLLKKTEMADWTLKQCRFSHNIAESDWKESISIYERNFCLLAMQWLEPDAKVRGARPPLKKVREPDPPFPMPTINLKPGLVILYDNTKSGLKTYQIINSCNRWVFRLWGNRGAKF